MSAATPGSTLDALRWRYATKVFDTTRRIPQDTWDLIEESLVLTPSSFGLQPWKFLVVENPGLRAELRKESWGQSQITDASHFVVFTARTDVSAEDIDGWITRLAEVQGAPAEALAPMKSVIEGFVGGMAVDARHAWNVRQVYIALGQFMTATAMMGIDTCPMEGMNAAGYDRVLGLEGSGYTTAVACAAGYRAPDDRHAARPKARFHPSNIITRLS